MKGIKFYLEYPNSAEKRKATRTNLGNHSGNVIAVLDNGIYLSGGEPVEDCLSAVYYYPNSPTATGGVALAYLRERAKRISEKQAREIHPELFTRLDYEP